MKKIIATVLAMVMALALCVTAFAAANEYKAYDKTGKALGGEKTVFTYETFKASQAENHDDGEVAHYVVKADGVKFGTYVVAADAKTYDLKLTTDGKAPLYLVEALNEGKYDYKATAFKAVGKECGQLDVDTDETYYTATDVNDKVIYFVATEHGTVTLLVDGKLVAAEQTAKQTLTAHKWVASKYDAAGKNVTEYTCSKCKTVAKVYPSKDAATADGMKQFDSTLMIGYNFTAKGAGTAAGTTTTSGSPKTFDAGIAMYAGMALMSVAGSAVVIGKKKEF